MEIVTLVMKVMMTARIKIAVKESLDVVLKVILTGILM
jgi:hypothetical protein